MGASTERERVTRRVIRACAVAPTFAAFAILFCGGCTVAAAAAGDQALDHLAAPRVGLPLSPWLIGAFAIVLVAAVWRVLRRVRRLLPEPTPSETASGIAPPRMGLDRLAAFGRPRISLHGPQDRAEPMFESAGPDDLLADDSEDHDAAHLYEPELVEPVASVLDDDSRDADSTDFGFEAGRSEAAFAEPDVEPAFVEPDAEPDLAEPALEAPFAEPAAEPVAAAPETDEEAIASVLAFAPRRQKRAPLSRPAATQQGRAEPATGPSEAAPHTRADLIVVLSLVDSLPSGPAARVLARQLAASGRTILVDLEGLLKIDGAGLGALVAGGVGFADAIRREPGSRLHLIAGGDRSEVTREGLDLVVEALCETYDFVIVAAGRPTDALGAELAGGARFGLLVGQDLVPDEMVAEARTLFAPECEILLAPVEGLRDAAA